jgi:hypothetical protein
MTDKRRAGCGESRMPGSEGGVGRRASANAPCSYPTPLPIPVGGEPLGRSAWGMHPRGEIAGPERYG